MIFSLQGPNESGQKRLWYVIYTCSRHESKVEMGLSRKGLEVFLPKVMVRSRRRDRVEMLIVPLFPGYLFVRSELGDFQQNHILKQDGVVRILGIKGQYTPLPEDTVNSIRTLVSSGQPVFPWSKLVPGKRVRVVNGPLVGALGVILRLKGGKSRLVVGVELLGRSVCVEFAEESVEIER